MDTILHERGPKPTEIIFCADCLTRRNGPTANARTTFAGVLATILIP